MANRFILFRKHLGYYMDDYLKDAYILGINDDYVDLVENVDKMVYDVKGHD